MSDRIKYFIFYLFAVFVAPFHFAPKKCYVIEKCKCPIWNCKFHYKNGKFGECQKLNWKNDLGAKRSN